MIKLSRVEMIAGVLLLSSVFQSKELLAIATQKSPALVPGAFATAFPIPNRQQCTHKVGRIWFTVTNYGFLGNQNDPQLIDCITGTSTSSAEFPGGSKIEHLFQACLWIGAIVAGDTLVSTGTDGWAVDDFELWPDAGMNGEIVKRSTNPGSPYFSPNAISQLDLIATMFDTLTDPTYVQIDPS